MIAHLSPPEPGKRPKYPWEQWFDGQEWTIMRGRDYWSDTDMMHRTIIGAASQQRTRVEITSGRADLFVTFRAVPREVA